MSHEEALGFAHILLIILVFALEIPVLIVEASAEDRLRHLLHKRVPHRAITVLMVLTLAVVVLLISLAGSNEPPPSARTTAPPVAVARTKVPVMPKPIAHGQRPQAVAKQVPTVSFARDILASR